MLYFAAFLVFAGPLLVGWYFSDALSDTTYIAAFIVFAGPLVAGFIYSK